MTPELNPGHIGGRRSLSPLRHPCSLVAKQRFLSLKERFRLAENLHCTRPSPSVIFIMLAACKTDLITARDRKTKSTLKSSQFKPFYGPIDEALRASLVSFSAQW